MVNSHRLNIRAWSWSQTMNESHGHTCQLALSKNVLKIAIQKKILKPSVLVMKKWATETKNVSGLIYVPAIIITFFNATAIAVILQLPHLLFLLLPVVLDLYCYCIDHQCLPMARIMVWPTKFNFHSLRNAINMTYFSNSHTYLKIKCVMNEVKPQTAASL